MNRFKEFVLVGLGAVFFSVCLTYPLALQMGNRTIELGDSRLNAYLQAWVSHALSSNPENLFDANMFYPAKDTLALSENMLGNQLFFGPVYAATKNSILSSNFVILVSFILCAITMYWLVKSMTGDPWAAVIAAFVYAFAPVRLHQLDHMQLLSTQWMPPMVLFLYRFLLRLRIADLIAFCGFVALQILCSLYLGYLALLVAICFFAAVLLVRPRLLGTRAMIRLSCGTLIVVALLYPLTRPYQRLDAATFAPASAMDLELAGKASANPIGDYLNGSGQLYGNLLTRFSSHDYDWEKKLFVGFVPLILALFSLPFAFRCLVSTWFGRCSFNAKEDSSSELSRLDNFTMLVAGSLLITSLSYLLSLGPFLRLHDQITTFRMPFFWLREWIPGFKLFRVPARFGLVFMFGFAILAGVGFSRLLRLCRRYGLARFAWINAVATLSVLVLIALEFDPAPLKLEPVMVPSNVAPEYLWLRSQPLTLAVLELPITFRKNAPDPYEQSGYIYASSFHWHPLVNGYSGYLPPTMPEMYRLAQEMPSPEAAAILGSLGVRYIILHVSRLSPDSLSDWNSKALHLKEVARFNESVIFEIEGSGCSAGLESVDIGRLQSPIAGEVGKPFPFAFSARSGKCWGNTMDALDGPLATEWKDEAGKTFRVVSKGHWPLYLHAGEESQITEFVPTPDKAGTYWFRVVNAGNRALDLLPQRVILRHSSTALATNYPADLSAHYDLRSISSRLVIGKKAEIDLLVTNDGNSIWRPDAGRGPIRLGYRWYETDGTEVRNSSGRVELPFAIYPNASYSFHASIDVPGRPGSYVLSLEMVSEEVTWFRDRGVRPLDIPTVVFSH